MSETDRYILESIKFWIWSGFYGIDDIHKMIDDILEEDANEAFLRSTVAPEFEKKAAAEESWPDETDCDRLDQAFELLNANGIIALPNTGLTQSDGLDDVGEMLNRRGSAGVKGYCFYHGQDLERAVRGAGLWLAFGDLDSDSGQKVAIGKSIKESLEFKGFAVDWNGDPDTRLNIPNLDWKRRRTV